MVIKFPKVGFPPLIRIFPCEQEANHQYKSVPKDYAGMQLLVAGPLGR